MINLAARSICVVATLAALSFSQAAGAESPAAKKPAASAAKSERLPKFKDFPAEQIYKGKPARLRIDTETKRYERSYFESIAEKGVKFAGHYTIVELPCGTTCRAPNILDLRTGRTVEMPFGTISGWQEYHDDFEPTEVKPDSRLIVFAGARNEEPPVGYHYYVLERGKLKFLRTVETGGMFMTPFSKE